MPLILLLLYFVFVGAGGFENVLRKHFEEVGRIDAEQSIFVQTASSVIYNQDGSQRFAEMAVPFDNVISKSI